MKQTKAKCKKKSSRDTENLRSLQYISNTISSSKHLQTVKIKILPSFQVETPIDITAKTGHKESA